VANLFGPPCMSFP